jgi:hypothetical protein
MKIESKRVEEVLVYHIPQYKCDFCGKEYDENEIPSRGKWFIWDKTTHTWGTVSKDLCIDCLCKHRCKNADRIRR